MVAGRIGAERNRQLGGEVELSSKKWQMAAMDQERISAAVAEIELWADSLEKTGHYFHGLREKAIAVHAEAMPDDLRRRLAGSIERIARLAQPRN